MTVLIADLKSPMDLLADRDLTDRSITQIWSPFGRIWAAESQSHSADYERTVRHAQLTSYCRRRHAGRSPAHLRALRGLEDCNEITPPSPHPAQPHVCRRGHLGPLQCDPRGLARDVDEAR